MTELWLPPGTKTADRADRPAIKPSDLLLADRRLLTYCGVETITDGHTTIVLHGWLCVRDGLQVRASLDNAKPHGLLLHVSLSYPRALPHWETVKQVKDAFFGDVDAAMILPRKQDYVNAHKYCFHLWELPLSWGIG